jgi:hypothetical protein
MFSFIGFIFGKGRGLVNPRIYEFVITLSRVSPVVFGMYYLKDGLMTALDLL